MLKEKPIVRILTVVFVLLAIGILPISVQGAPQKGGSMKLISTTGDVGCLGVGTELRLLYQVLFSQPVVERLVRWDEKGQIVPQLAEKWEFSKDQKSVTFYLRKGVKFHDGTDFDAEAVKFNIEKLKKFPQT